LPLIGAGDEKPKPAAPSGTQPQQLAGPRVKVLFVGDKGHHVPLERFRQSVGEMMARGVDFTYTDDLSQINPANLHRFDALLLYANWTKATPEIEKSILDYVAEGHGYAVIHCASYCWLNSQPLTELAGGRFKRHGTGVFKETHVKSDHPILAGLHEIQSWDETYVHEMHNEKDRTVLSVREDKEGKEPYTWVRTHGKGRVFYTAWGHDERTWSNKDFLDLLERGVRWSAGDQFLAAKTYLPPFEYSEGKAPNYTAGGKWGDMGEFITKIQKPLSVEESVKHMVLPPGVEAKLYASDPQIYKPICMAWDERGRLWIAETVDYPNEMQEPGQGRDRIVTLEDTDGDGVADKFTVFAEKLSIPTSFCFANGGLVVVQAPDTLFLQDTDGDGKADVRKVLFSGWGTRDTHAGPSSLHYGFDNWIYGIVGYSGFNGTVGGETLRFSQAIWRMKPDGSKLEALASVTNNAWGIGFSEDGNLFASTANNAPSFYMHIPNRAYESVRGMNVSGLRPINDTPHFYPVASAQVRQMDQHGAYTAAAGHELYTARTWPAAYWNRIAFVNEPTGHLVGQFLLQPNGSAFVAQNEANMFASTDGWTSPIMSLVGPDGQVWMIDWYNYIIQHNPIPKGFVGGKGGAYVTDLRDKTHGRIYRLVYKDGTPSKTFKLSKDDPKALIEALKSDNMGWRMHAQRLLVERGNGDVTEQLLQIATDPSVDALGMNPPAVHALWTLSGLGALNGKNEKTMATVVAALGSKSISVRKAAVEVLPRTADGLAAILSSKILADKDPQVRKSALLALAEMPQGSEADAGKKIWDVVGSPEVSNDRWLTDAATIAAARHDAAFLKAALTAYKLPEKNGVPTAEDPKTPRNLIQNPSFEEIEGNKPRGWAVRHYSGEATQELSTTVAHTGKNSLVLRSDRGSDTSWHIDVRCEPNTHYRLSAWIKTENVKPLRGGLGALLNVHQTEYKTPAVVGTSDWKRVEVSFDSGRATRLSINCLFGGWGHATGVAYYDDIELTKMGGTTNLPGASGKVLSAVITHYALRAPKDSVVQTLASLKAADPKIATVVIDALAASWPDRTPPDLSAADATELQAVMKALPQTGKDRLLALATKWGKADIFGEALAGSIKDTTAAVNDEKLSPAQRGEAAKRLIAVADNPESAKTILQHVNAKASPELQIALITAADDSRNPAVGEMLIEQWSKLTPTTQKAALRVLLHREAWTKSLLAGIKKGTVNGKDLQPQDWQSMTAHPDDQIAKQAKALQKTMGQAINPDRQALVDKFMPITQKKGDPKLGQQIFEKNCQVCHTLEGKGGKVGPELTGVGAKPKGDILIDILDPNRSVEGTFRMWTARTEDDVIAGRLISESQTSVEIIDAAGAVHPVQRSQIKKLEASNLSVMPEGFEQLPQEDLTNLLEFLSMSKVKH
jgi:putative membrane-bound dehydrogenase-like protein